MQLNHRRAVSKVVVTAVIIVVIVVAGFAIFTLNGGSPTSTSSSGSSTSYSTSSSVSSSSSSTSQVSSSSGNGTLVIDEFLWQGANGGNVGPNLLYGSVDWPEWGEGSVYQSLITINLTAEQNFNQLQFLPDLAVNWTVSPNSSIYTFHLRHGVTFSNGDAFNAYNVWTQFYMEYYLYANSSTFWEGSSIFNMGSVNFGLSTMRAINQSGLAQPSQQLLAMMTNKAWPVYTTDPYTVVYRLNSPFLFFLGTLPGWLGLTFDPMYVLQHGGPGPVGSINSYFNAHAMPGTGPYVETKIVPTSYAVFTKNPTYWGKNLTAVQIAANPILDPGHYNQIIVQNKPDDTSRYVDLTTGRAQIAVVETSNFRLIQRDPNYAYMTLKYPAEAERMSMNTQIFPTNNTDLRLAIVHAINYTDVINTAVFGYGLPFVGPETPNFGAYSNPGNAPAYQYNLTLAKQYLAQAGFPDGKGLPTLTMWIDAAALSYEQPQAEIIQADLAQIGINTNIQVVLTSQYYSYFGSYQYELQNAQNIPNIIFDGSIPYAPDFMTPVDYWSFFVTNYTLFGNYAVYSNPIVNQNVAFMFHSGDQTAVLQHLAVAQAQIQKDAPYAWLYDAQLAVAAGSYAYNKHIVGGFLADPNLEGVCTVPILNTVYPAS